MSGSRNLQAWVRVLLKLPSGLLTVSLLIQFFIAGMSSVTNPDWWAYHKVWVGTFQWLVLPLPVFAWLCGLTARCCLAIDIRDIVREAADDKKTMRARKRTGRGGQSS